MVSLKLAESLRRSTLGQVDRLKIVVRDVKATVGRAMTVGRAAATVHWLPSLQGLP